MKVKEVLSRLKDPIFRSKLDSRFGIGRLEKLLFTNWFNPFLSIWLNFRSLPFKTAFWMPIWVYGRPRLYCLSGRILIKTKLRPGLIRFNVVHSGAPCNMSTQSEIYNLGTITFAGQCDIGTGTKIIVGYDAELLLGGDNLIADRCNITVYNKVEIGNKTRIAHNSQIFDTNFHFIADLNKGIIGKKTKPIYIGSACWICNSTTVMKGTVIPDYAIVGSHSLVNKDFSDCKGGCIIVGNPAKVVKLNCVRVFNSKIEDEIWKYFREKSKNEFPLKGMNIEDLVKSVR